MSERAGDWMETVSGRRIWPLDIRHGDVVPEDVAHALGMTCRYGGHTASFYSVAEHCCLLADHAIATTGDARLALDLLIHDAAEAYLGDIPRPLKACLPAEWKKIEKAADEACTRALGGRWPWPAAVKDLDHAILLDERAAMMSESGNHWDSLDGIAALGVQIHRWSPETARSEWLARYRLLRAYAPVAPTQAEEQQEVEPSPVGDPVGTWAASEDGREITLSVGGVRRGAIFPWTDTKTGELAWWSGIVAWEGEDYEVRGFHDTKAEAQEVVEGIVRLMLEGQDVRGQLGFKIEQEAGDA